MYRLIPLLFPLLLLAPSPVAAWYPRLADEMVLSTRPGQVLGHNLDYLPTAGETLMEIARRAGIGFENLQRANPGVDPWNPVAGRSLLLPRAVLLPQDAGRGITINLAELRLFLIWEEDGRQLVRIYPVGIGREGWETPLGDFRIASVIEKPSWTPPASLRLEKPELPQLVPAGPNNPLGDYWIGLTAPGVGLHGTNQPYGVGRRVSHGCLRLYPEDIRDLVTRISPGMSVKIVDQPVKHAISGKQLLIEAHRPGSEVPTTAEMLKPLSRGLSTQLQHVINESRGIPIAFRVGP